ncbi:VOC family protein [Marinicrinis lubricantis]|uniref:VOC family protein n=1 Tax=Marinicrinis lubricantis TaxID=2086470 RepID=A0ABW1IJB9_9BACL
MRAIKLRPFVPSGADYPLAVQFYVDLGFEIIFASEELTIFKTSELEFHLQNYHNVELQNNFMLELCVQDLDTWWKHIQDIGVAEKYNIKANPPQLQSYGKRALHLTDPAGVLWHFTE